MKKEIYIRQGIYKSQSTPYPCDKEEKRIGLGYYFDGQECTAYFVRVELPVSGVIHHEEFPVANFCDAVSRFNFYCDRL